MTQFKRIWQEQPREKTKVSLDEIREKALRLARLRRLVGWTALPAIVLCTLFFVGVLVRAVSRPLWIGAYGNTFYGRSLWIAIDRLPLIPIGIGIYLAHLSISSFIRPKTLVPDAGPKTSVAAYRAHYEWERGIFLQVLGVFAVSMAAIGLDTAGWWMRMSTFPIEDALQFAGGYALIGILTYIAYKHHQLKMRRELMMLDALETDE